MAAHARGIRRGTEVLHARDRLSGRRGVRSIFENCEHYPRTADFEKFWFWIRTFQINTDLFYAPYRDLSVVRIRQLEAFKRRFDAFVASVRSPTGLGSGRWTSCSTVPSGKSTICDGLSDAGGTYASDGSQEENEVTGEDPNEPPELSANVQAHLLRAAKMPAGPEMREQGKSYETRNWSLFLFFRVMQQAEMRETATRLKAAKNPKPEDSTTAKGAFLKDFEDLPAWRAKLDLALPAMLNGGLASQAATDEYQERRNAAAPLVPLALGESAAPAPAAGPSPAPRGQPSAGWKSTAEAPAPAFLNWLRVLVRGNRDDRAQLLDAARRFSAEVGAGSGILGTVVDPTPAGIQALAIESAADFLGGDLRRILGIAANLEELIAAVTADYPGILAAIHESVDAVPAATPSAHGACDPA